MKAFTAVHEIGHHLDNVLGSGGVGFASEEHPALKEINAAIEKTSSAKELNRMAKSAKGKRDAATPHEKFARAYEQYVATKSGDAKLKSQLDSQRSNGYFGKQNTGLTKIFPV